MIYFITGLLIMMLPGLLVGWRAAGEFAYHGKLSLLSATLAMIAFAGQVTITLLAALAGALPLDVAEVPMIVLGAAVGLGGAALHLLARIQWSFKMAWGLSTDRLITGGIYRFTRNPQVLGWFLMELGAGLAGRSLAAIALSVVFLTGFALWLPIEERMLEARFGPEYRRYRAKVPRFILPGTEQIDARATQPRLSESSLAEI
jgi:protein-S-isoprenylcysteine O-methyltransferase Ste14